MSHDSRGALLKKGDRVFVEGVLTEDPSADAGYCNANVKFVTPDQKDPPPMTPPNNVFNTRMLTKLSALLLLATAYCLLATANAQSPKAKPAEKPAATETAPAPAKTPEPDVDVSWRAKQEIARRGPMVERVNGFEADSDQAYFVEALSPPADDSNKWCVTLVTTQGCKFCDQLRGDFEQAAALQPWVNVKDYTKSWAHYQVVQIEDKSQAWRWKDFQPKVFPTLILQPPFDRSWGDPHTIVFLKEGYDGKPDKLAQNLRAAIDKYVKLVKPQRTAWKATHSLASNHNNGGGMEQTGGWNPPATPPSVLPPGTPSPATTVPPMTDPTPASGGLTIPLALPSLQTILLFLTAVSNVWLLVRDYLSKAGVKLMLSDDQVKKLMDLLARFSPTAGIPPKDSAT